MKKSLTALAATCTVLTLAGCSTPPAIFAPDPVIIEHEKTLDRVHNRDASMEFYGESRGGAAVRQDMAAHVLWNEHYVADAKALAAKAEAERLAAIAKAEEEARQAALLKAKQDAEKKKALSAKGSKASKDKSIYAKKDRSIYKDRSVYSKAKPATQVKQNPASKTDAETKAKALAEAKLKVEQAKAAVRAQEVEKIKREAQEVSTEKLNQVKKFEPKPLVVEALKLAPMPENPTPKPSKPGGPCCGVSPAAQAPVAETTAK